MSTPAKLEEFLDITQSLSNALIHVENYGVGALVVIEDPNDSVDDGFRDGKTLPKTELGREG